jgi:hypothetical protein
VRFGKLADRGPDNRIRGFRSGRATQTFDGTGANARPINASAVDVDFLQLLDSQQRILLSRSVARRHFGRSAGAYPRHEDQCRYSHRLETPLLSGSNQSRILQVLGAWLQISRSRLKRAGMP